jgi:anti-sigma-K factor RskA
MDRNTLLDLIPAYAIGALDSDERAEVEAFLAADAEAREMLAEYQALSDSLILTTPVKRAPSHLNADLRQRLAASRPASTAPTLVQTTLPAVPPPIQVVKPVRRTPTWTPYVLAAAAAFAIVLAVILLLRPQTPPTDPAQRYEWIIAQAGVQHIPLAPSDPSPDTAGKLVLTADGQYGVIEVWGLPPIQEGQTFQLWLIDDSGAHSGGLLEFAQPQGPNYISLPIPSEKAADDYDAFGLSIEPEGGSPDPNGPTGDRVFGVSPQA